MFVHDLMTNDIGNKIISAFLGFGFALIFQRVCTGNNCVVIKGPDPKIVSQNYYKIGKNCYKYTPRSVEC